MAWLVLMFSGALEAVWARALAASEGFRHWRPSVLFVGALTLSMTGLAWAMRTLPTGTAYAVWVGIGATLTVVIGLLRKEEDASVARLGFLVLLVGSVIGLKVVS